MEVNGPLPFFSLYSGSEFSLEIDLAKREKNFEDYKWPIEITK